MIVKTLGKIAPSSAGTPVQCTTDRTIVAQKLLVSQIPGTSGNTFFGRSTLTKATYVGVIKGFLPATGANGFTDTLEIDADGGNPICLADYWVDADTNGQGLLIAYCEG
jgi:hypothetical protein